jgi:hypothetical protein
MEMKKVLSLAAILGTFACLLLPVCGCDSSKPEFGSAPDEVIQLVEGIPDGIRSPQAFAALFSSTSPPNEMQRRQFAQCMFIARSARVSGDEATAKVEVRNRATDESIGEVEWTIVKEGAHWKLKDAPLPTASQ